MPAGDSWRSVARPSGAFGRQSVTHRSIRRTEKHGGVIVIKKIRASALTVVVLATLSLSALPLFAAANASAVAVSELPCYDMWRGCLDGGGSSSYCEGVWLGCMNKTYGTLAN
jgi:hypothetical protein